jgi:hypothetical protein
MPCTKTIAPPSQPPRTSKTKPIKVNTNAPALTSPCVYPPWPKIAASAKKNGSANHRRHVRGGGFPDLAAPLECQPVGKAGEGGEDGRD